MSNEKLEIIGKTWIRDSNELIDYLNEEYLISEFTIKSEKSIYRVNDLIEIDDYNTTNNSSERYLLSKISYKNGKYFYISNSLHNNEIAIPNLSWLVYRNSEVKKDNHYKLIKGDVLKLGKIWLLVRKINLINQKSNNSTINGSFNRININGDSNTNYINPQRIKIKSSKKLKDKEESLIKNRLGRYSNLSKKDATLSITKLESTIGLSNQNSDLEFNHHNNIKSKLIKYKTYKKENNKICRICYSDDIDNNENPLIKPCKCSGSMKYVHIQCLLHWLKTKINIKTYIDNPLLTTLTINKVKCELCQEELPDYIKHNGKIYSLNDFEQFEYKNENYIIFDTIEHENNIDRTRYIIKFDKSNKIKIGRGIESNLIINEVSISRVHCLIHLNNNGDVIINDCNSKFATLILLQNNNLEILSGQKLGVQVGRTYLTFNIHISCSFFGCCKSDISDKDIDYEQLNRKYVHIKNKKSNEFKVFSEEESNESEFDDEYEIFQNGNEKKNNLKIIEEEKQNDIKNKNKMLEITNITNTPNTTNLKNITPSSNGIIYHNNVRNNNE